MALLNVSPPRIAPPSNRATPLAVLQPEHCMDLFLCRRRIDGRINRRIDKFDRPKAKQGFFIGDVLNMFLNV